MNIPQRVPINNILQGSQDMDPSQTRSGLNQTIPEYQRHQMRPADNFPEAERGGMNMFTPGMGAPNYMQYSAGGTYDDGKYSQYAVADYASATESPFPPRRNGPVSQPPFDPSLLDGITAGRTADTGSAIRSGQSNRELEWTMGNGNRSGQSAPNERLPTKAFEVIESPPPRPAPQASTSYYSCPVCNEIAIRVANSPTRDAMCRNAHIWKIINGQKVVA
jgi:hypothetical protein